MTKINQNALEKRILRVRSKVRGTQDRPRLHVFRSNQHIYAQIINDDTGKTLVNASDVEVKEKATKAEKAQKVGENLAMLAKKHKITKVTFDRGPYKYHGRVKALADGARSAGLEF
jgi:large subunit ribosomal protein L18